MFITFISAEHVNFSNRKDILPKVKLIMFCLQLTMATLPTLGTWLGVISHVSPYFSQSLVKLNYLIFLNG